MNATRAAKALAINQGTLKLWIDRPELATYFSASARREGFSRDLNDDDVIVANTIRSLRAGVGNNNVDWQQIADQLNSGYRDRSLPPEADHVDTGLTVIAQHERIAAIVTERDAANARVSELEKQVRELLDRVDTLHNERREEAERLLREQAQIRDEKLKEQQELRDQLVRAQVELELWRSGRLKPE
jgi:hypothetical protein